MLNPNTDAAENAKPEAFEDIIHDVQASHHSTGSIGHQEPGPGTIGSELGGFAVTPRRGVIAEHMPEQSVESHSDTHIADIRHKASQRMFLGTDERRALQKEDFRGSHTDAQGSGNPYDQLKRKNEPRSRF